MDTTSTQYPVEVFKVPVEHIAAVWPRAAALLEPAIARQGTHEAKDVLSSLLLAQSHLFIQLHIGEMLCAVVTKFNQYPKGLYLTIWFIGGQPDYGLLQKVIIGWGKITGCTHVELYGRPGWIKRYSKARETLTVLRQPIEDFEDDTINRL